MDTNKLSDTQRRIRSNVRNFLMVATHADLQAELTISVERGDTFRADCVRELIREDVGAIDDALHGERWEATGN